MASLIDPTITGKYPVVLGEGLLGGNSNDIFTGIKYNHKPPLSSGDAPEHARLKPSLPGKTSSYDLSFMDGGSGYAYAGTRNTDDNQYVLHFDPERKVFVLDKIDSTFHMNLTRLPTNTDPDSLSRRFPHLEVTDGPKADAGKSAVESGTADKSKATQGPKATKPGTKQRAKSPIPVKEAKRKPAPKKEQNSAPLNLPKPQPAEKKKEPEPKRKKQIEEDEEDEDDDDGGLTIEYPGADLSRKRTDFSPAFPAVQRFDDFMDQRESEGDDADGESDSDMEFKLPSPVNHQENKAPTPPSYQQHVQAHGHGQEEEDDDDLAADLEKDLENAFEDLANSNQGTPNHDGDESEISEED